jgi:glycerophosphoryl diester phosphodiesterase
MNGSRYPVVFLARPHSLHFQRKLIVKKIRIIACGIVLVFGLAACHASTTDLVKAPTEKHPLVIAHRAGGGQWPQNSRTAVLNCIARAQDKNPQNRYDGLEMDIVLTKDGIPVLSHDPWVHTTLCTTASGDPLRERVLIHDRTLAQLQSDYLCGGVREPDFPQVNPKAEPIMTLDEVLQALKKAPNMVLYLDVKIDGGLTASAQEYAKAISARWQAAGLSNRLYVEGPSPESLAAYRSVFKTDFVPVLSYPAFTVTENFTWTAIKAFLLTNLRLRSPLAEARQAHAGAVAAPTQVITRHAAQEARDNGVQMVLFTPNTRNDLEKYCRWPVDVLITDYPDLGHCP